jgi:hypothetical protein
MAASGNTEAVPLMPRGRISSGPELAGRGAGQGHIERLLAGPGRQWPSPVSLHQDGLEARRMRARCGCNQSSLIHHVELL